MMPNAVQPEELDYVKTSFFRAPRTILGFLAIALGITFTGSAVVVAALTRVPALHRLIGYVLIFDSVAVVALVGIVIWMSKRDPMALQLGEVTGSTYLESRKMLQGDSKSGEKVIEVNIDPTLVVTTGLTRAGHTAALNPPSKSASTSTSANTEDQE